ncbi:hypothetical protein E4T56_gene2727 [Termitomyces sp. T112]|nr:hypothetical protein E4T56_gene2727 [Termitomyces sp. T112]
MGEFMKWLMKLKIFLQQSGLDHYIFAPESKPDCLIRQPNPNTEPVVYANWLSNNNLIIGVICATVSDAKQEGLSTDGTANECYDMLKAQANCKGPVKQVTLICKALSTYVPIAKPIENTTRKICELVDHAFTISRVIDKDLLKCIALLNSINNKHFKSIQVEVSCRLADSTKEKTYTSSDIQKLFQTSNSLANLSKPSSDTMLVAKDSRTIAHTHNHGPRYPCCKVCFELGLPCHGHTKPWCIKPGGGIAGKTIEESKTTQRAAQGGGKTSGATKTEGGSSKNGIAIEAAKNDMLKSAEFVGVTSSTQEISTDFFEYQGFMAIKDDLNNFGDELRVTINWSDSIICNYKTILATTTIVPLNQLEHTTLVSLNNKPFYLNSSTTIHISPCWSDFVTLQAIPPCSVRGVGGTSIEAVGIGQIHLHIQNKAEIILENVLYIPISTVCLISMSALITSMCASIIFSSIDITILDDISAALAKHALATQHSVNLDTWHWQLGHANYQVVTTMACAGLLPGTPNAPPNFRPCPAPTSANSDASPANSDGPLANFGACPAATDTYPGPSRTPRTPPAVPNLRHPSSTQHPGSSDLFRSITTTSGQPAFSNDPINISARHNPQSQPTPAPSIELRQAPPPQPTYPKVLW